MATERSNQPSRPPLKPSLSSNRTARAPVTPRIAAVNTTTYDKSASPYSTLTARSEPLTPKVKQVNTPVNDALVNGNVTPRSSARASRSESPNVSPATATKVKSPGLRASANGGFSGVENGASASRPKIRANDKIKPQSPLVRSPGSFNHDGRQGDNSMNSNFFLASEALKQDTAPRTAEPQKKAQFYHVDGKEEANGVSFEVASPVLSAVSEQRSAGPWSRLENRPQPAVSPPMLSPALSALSSTSPFFPASSLQSSKQTSPTASKENIHLSYRKGASQIIGMRPNPPSRSTTSNGDDHDLDGGQDRRGSLEPSISSFGWHRKSPSLSAMGSTKSLPLRRRSSMITDVEPLPSPLAHEIKPLSTTRLPNPPIDLPSIETSIERPSVLSRTESGLSPTKPGPDLAADARRERKVLDLEISNSSLMAINTSLEREIRRQKAELKRFRRLSWAGRFSIGSTDRMRTPSADLSALAEEDEEDDIFGLPSHPLDEEDLSDDDDSLVSSSEPLSTAGQDRLARDEKRLQVDLEKHKELLVQSQAMNQSIKRCMYATEDMIQEGKKALQYHVRVSDFKLGGRVLSNHEADEPSEIEIEDEMLEEDDDLDQPAGALEKERDTDYTDFDGNGGGDRDSGIEVDRSGPALPQDFHPEVATYPSGGRPRLRDMERFGSFS